jgi:hypothetical protein
MWFVMTELVDMYLAGLSSDRCWLSLNDIGSERI